MAYVIRSMSTTNYYIGGPPVVPYHIYLRRPELRERAWWYRGIHEAQKFPTFEAALAEKNRLAVIDRADIVPEKHDRFPAYWECSHYMGVR